MSHLTIRLAKPSDASALCAIYRPYVETTAVTFETTAPDEKEFERRVLETLKKYPYLVADDGGEVVGYAYAGAFKARAAYDWSVETSIYVKAGLTGQGIGTALLCALEDALRGMGIRNANACIAYADPEDEYLKNGSRTFHERMGYTLVGRFRKCACKFGRWYDMIWMEKALGAHEPDPEPPRFGVFAGVEE